jgi:hypothetical protein
MEETIKSQHNKWQSIGWEEAGNIIEVDQNQEMEVDRDWVKRIRVVHLVRVGMIQQVHRIILMDRIQIMEVNMELRSKIYRLSNLWNQLNSQWLVIRNISLWSQ